MTLYLSPEITPEEIEKAKLAGIAGVKSYPKGVTTNSDAGVVSYEQYYPVFEAMQKHDLVLNLHGEVPTSPEYPDITVMSAEEAFLPTLHTIHSAFPQLRIVLEHCTTKAAVDAVKQCGPTVSATITAHHLFLTVDAWADNVFSYCKPVAKLPADRDALREAATSGDPRFFFGSDSAPHPVTSKVRGKGTAAGVFTQPYALSYVAQVFHELGKMDNLEKFTSLNGRRFYKLDKAVVSERVQLTPDGTHIKETLGSEALTIVPFMAGENLTYRVQWK